MGKLRKLEDDAGKSIRYLPDLRFNWIIFLRINSWTYIYLIVIYFKELIFWMYEYVLILEITEMDFQKFWN